jgi:hypothetical protein
LAAAGRASNKEAMFNRLKDLVILAGTACRRRQRKDENSQEIEWVTSTRGYTDPVRLAA